MKILNWLVGGTFWANAAALALGFSVVFGAWQLDRWQVFRAGAANNQAKVEAANGQATKIGSQAAQKSGNPDGATARGVRFGTYRD